MLSTSAFLALAMNCAPSIHPATLTPIIKTESAFNPWAIGVVGKSLTKQPQSLEEAVLAVKKLVKEGANFSIGLGQINRQHFDVNKSESVFDPCTNLRMTASVLQDCYVNAVERGTPTQVALLQAISCYYSGNISRGFKAEKEFGGSSHVQRVLANAENSKVQVPALENVNPTLNPALPTEPAMQPIYESWDVLRQYPRFEPTAPPKAPASNQKPTPKDIQEESDA
ncbi:lytic transglycosylase domain-containing protein [Pseudomonas kitaguniensis]|uniref:lytic transglycosylase domain-containing protein n=1 Tax=Pseudomonas kitaguniensis TaxID=2607908 RepID=UPI003BA20BB1